MYRYGILIQNEKSTYEFHSHRDKRVGECKLFDVYLIWQIWDVECLKNRCFAQMRLYGDYWLFSLGKHCVRIYKQGKWRRMLHSRVSYSKFQIKILLLATIPNSMYGCIYCGKPHQNYKQIPLMEVSLEISRLFQYWKCLIKM